MKNAALLPNWLLAIILTVCWRVDRVRNGLWPEVKRRWPTVYLTTWRNRVFVLFRLGDWTRRRIAEILFICAAFGFVLLAVAFQLPTWAVLPSAVAWGAFVLPSVGTRLMKWAISPLPALERASPPGDVGIYCRGTGARKGM